MRGKASPTNVLTIVLSSLDCHFLLLLLLDGQLKLVPLEGHSVSTVLLPTVELVANHYITVRRQKIVLIDQLLLAGTLALGVFDNESLYVLILGKDSAVELYFGQFIEGLAISDFLLELIVPGSISLPPSEDIVILYILEEVALCLLLLSQLAEAYLVEDLYEHVHIIRSHVSTIHVVSCRHFVGQAVHALLNRVHKLFLMLLLLPKCRFLSS